MWRRVPSHDVPLPPGLPIPPAQLPPRKDMSDFIDSEVFDWAASFTTGPDPMPKPQDLSVCLRTLLPTSVVDVLEREAVEEEANQKTYREYLATKDFICILGSDHSGKTEMGPFLCFTLAEENRNALEQDDPSVDPKSVACYEDLYFHREAKYSQKTMFVAPNPTAAVHLTKKLQEFNHLLCINIYMSHAELAPADLMRDPERRDCNAVFNGVQNMKNVHAIVVDMYTAQELLDRNGFFGSIVIENFESFPAYPMLHTLLATAQQKIEVNKLGRVVLMSSDKTTEVFDKIMQKMEDGRFISRATMSMPPVQLEPLNVNAYNTRDAMQFAPPEHSALLGEIGFNAFPSVSDRAKCHVQAKFPNLPKNGHNEHRAFVGSEREWVEGRSADDNMRSPYPDEGFNKAEVEGMLREKMKDSLATANLDHIEPGREGTPAANKRVPSIYVLVSGPQAVSALGSIVKDMDEMYIQSERIRNSGALTGRVGTKNLQYCEAFSTTKMSFTWKLDRGIARNEETTSIESSVYQNEAGGVCRRGKLVIMTFDTALGISLDHVTTMIIAPSRLTRSRYQSHGLSFPKRAFVDGHAIRVLIDRFARRATAQKQPARWFMYAGSQCELARQLLNDTRWEMFEVGYGLTQFLMEFAHPDNKKNRRRFRADCLPQSTARTLKDDVLAMGMAKMVKLEDATEVPVMDEETRKLIGLLPGADPRLCRILVAGVRMGVATPTVAHVSMEMLNGRLSQQAAHSASMFDYSCPGIDVFTAAFKYIRHNRDRRVLLTPFESEAVARAELFGSFIPTYWHPKQTELKYQDFVGSYVNERYTRIPESNFWACRWACHDNGLSHGFTTDPAFARLRDRIGYGRLLKFPDLYTAFIKDEGREALHLLCHLINRALIHSGLVTTSSFLDPQYNRHRLSEHSVYMSMDGRSLFSGILAMYMTNVAKYNPVRDNMNKRLPPPPTEAPVLPIDKQARYPKRYEVYDGESETGKHADAKIIVNGYSVNIPAEGVPEADQLIMYHPSEDEIFGSRDSGCTRFHVTAHQITQGRLAVFGNIHAPCYTDDTTLVLPLTGAPNAGKCMRFKISKKAVNEPANENNEEAMEVDDPTPEDLINRVLKIREYLKTAVNAALCPRGNAMTQYEKIIISAWKTLGTPTPPRPAQ